MPLNPVSSMTTVLRLALGLALLTCTNGFAQAVPQLVNTAVDVELTYRYLGIDIESRCGADWFVIEGAYWKCLRRLPSGALAVTDKGPRPAYLPSLPIAIRKPIPGDRKIYFANNNFSLNDPNFVYSVDPVTLQTTYEGNLPVGYVREPIILADYNADGVAEMVLNETPILPPRLVSLPGGMAAPYQTVLSLPFMPTFSGQFDSDPQTEVGQISVFDSMPIYDSSTLLPETTGIGGSFSRTTPVWSGDWDGDGIDEIAAARPDLNRIYFLDLNAAAPSIFQILTGTGPFHGLGLVNWSAPGSREILIYGSDQVNIVNPRSGLTLQSAPITGLQTTTPELVYAGDWDGDGDGDVAWIDRENVLLRLMRNPEGASLVQEGSAEKIPLGLVDVGGQSRLVSAESFGKYPNGSIHLRLRDTSTLELIAEGVVPGAYQPLLSFGFGDLHSNPGKEVLFVTNQYLRLYALDGTLLWERTLADAPAAEFSRVVVPDATCVLAGCRRILASIDNGNQDRYQLIDGDNGTDIWASAPSFGAYPLALTDLNNDGSPDLLLSGEIISALDGETRGLIWQSTPSPNFGAAITSARSTDSARRLAIVFTNDFITYVDPDNGETLRALNFTLAGGNGCSHRCDLRYLRVGEHAGTWIANSPHQPMAIINRTLTGPVVDFQDPGLGTLGAEAMAPDTIYLGTAKKSIEQYAIAPDGIFDDSLEGW